MEGPAEFVDGKMFIGLILNVLLLGINITQTYFYYLHSKKDRLWIKIFVVVVFVLDFVQPLCGVLFLYQALVVHFGDVTQLLPANNVFAVVPTLMTMTASIIQIFFAWRIKVLTKNWFYFAFVITFAISGGVCGIAVAYEGNKTPQFTEFRRFKITPIIGFSSEMLAGIMITSILVCFFTNINQVFDPLIRWWIASSVSDLVTMQTGLLTLIFTGLDVLFYLINPGGTHLLLNLVLSKLYSTSFLSSLNSRQGWGYDAESTKGQWESSLDLGLRFASTSTRTAGLDVDTPPETPSTEQQQHEMKENFEQEGFTHANRDPELALKKVSTS